MKITFENKTLTLQRIITFVVLVVLLLVVVTCTESPEKYRVGILCGLDFFEDTVDGFKEKMSELGYIEGKNITYDFYHSNSDMDTARIILNKFVKDEVDLIFVMPTEVAVAAREIASVKGIPVVFANSNIEGVNLVNSVKEPGENITGVRYPGPDLTVKRFEIMMEIDPEIKKILVPYKRALEIVPDQLKALYSAAKTMNVEIIELPADSAKELEDYFRKIERENKLDFDAILFIAEPLMVTPATFTVTCKFAYDNQLPIGGALISVSEYESLFGVSTNNVAVGKQAAYSADKILRGAKAGSIPVVSAENYIQFNPNAAKRLKINLPPGLLKQSDGIN